MNIYDIADKAGVSIATVSRVLNHSPKVSPKTYARVMTVIDASGYVATSSIIFKKIAILCSTILNTENAYICENLMSRFKAQGIDAALHICGNNPADKKNTVNKCLDEKASAFIIIGSDFLEYDSEDNSYLVMAARKVPVFIAGGYLEGSGIYCAFYDFENAVHVLVDELTKRGRLHPLFVFPDMSQKCMNMLEGYRSACAHNKLGLSAEYSHLCKYGDAGKYLESLYSSNLSFDAIIASDDRLAIEATSYLMSKNISVPSDVEIIGCGNSMYADQFRPSLSSIAGDGLEICDYIYKSILNFSRDTVSTRTIFSAGLIKRDSSL